MKFGAFDLLEPLPELREPHALVMVRPWVDVGNVGSLTLQRLERHFRAQDLGELSRPGTFFDFTRYRPTIRTVDGRRETTCPNTVVRYAQPDSGPDLLFLHLLEPHAMAEDYLDSVMAVLKHFGAKVYCRIGAMYDSVPHTRPIVVTGNPGLVKPREGAKPAMIQQRQSGYEGPTTILNRLADSAEELGMATMSFMVHLPHYAQLDDDYAGTARMIEVLSAYYEVPASLAPMRRGKLQYAQLDAAVEREPEVKALLAELEAQYDARYQSVQAEEPPVLSPEIERFLKDLDPEF